MTLTILLDVGLGRPDEPVSVAYRHGDLLKEIGNLSPEERVALAETAAAQVRQAILEAGAFIDTMRLGRSRP